MRQETVTLTYLKFNELSEDQKTKVLEKLRDINTNYIDWHESVTDNFTDKLKSLGYSNIKTEFSGFWSQGDGASFSAIKDGVEITMRGHYCHKYSMQCDDKKLLEEARDLAHQYYRDLEKQYEYLTSDEVVIETIEANNYEFNSVTLKIG